MSRYIDAEKIIETIDNSADLGGALGKVVDCVKLYAKYMIETAPTADVVEVVRCKDCTWWKSIFSWNGKEHKVCVRDSSEPLREQNDFCSYGERREE